MRSGLCAQTLYGHLNSVNHLCFSTDDVIVSCDADGMVKLWDVRMVAGDSLRGLRAPASQGCFRQGRLWERLRWRRRRDGEVLQRGGQGL